MQVTIKNNVTIKCTSKEWIILEPKLHPYIVVDNKALEYKQNLGFSTYNDVQQFALADISFGKTYHKIVTPIGLWHYIKHLFDPNTVEYQVDNHQVPVNKVYKFKHLYGYQREAVTNMLPFRNGVLVAGTGSGKTMMGIALSLLKGKTVLWINDRIQLCRQARKTAIKHFHLPPEACGLLQGDNEFVKQYTFTTIQKISKVLNEGFNDVTQKLIHFDTIIIDECHHAVGSYNNYKQYFQALNELNYKHVYGLTATPKRPDGNEFMVHAVIGPVRFEVTRKTKTMKATVKNKYLNIDTTEELYESFVNKYTGKAMPSKVDEYLLFHDDYVKWSMDFIKGIIGSFKKVLIVSPRVAGAQMISDMLNVDHFLVYGAIKKREKMYTSKVIVATLPLVKEGFDVPELEAVIVLARKPSKHIVTQIVGRTERYVEGKKSPEAYFLIPRMKRFERKKKVVWEDLDLGKV